MILYVGMFVYQSLAHLRVFTPNPFYILVVSRSQTYSWTVQVVFLLGYVGHMWAQRITNISRKSENDAPTFGKLMPKKPEHGNGWYRWCQVFSWVLWHDPRNPQVPRKKLPCCCLLLYPNISHDGVQPIRSFLDVHRIRKWSIIHWNIPWFFPVKMLGMRISLGYHLGYWSEYSQWSSQDIPMIIFPMVGSPDLYQLRTGPSGGTRTLSGLTESVAQ